MPPTKRSFVPSPGLCFSIAPLSLTVRGEASRLARPPPIPGRRRESECAARSRAAAVFTTRREEIGGAGPPPASLNSACGPSLTTCLRGVEFPPGAAWLESESDANAHCARTVRGIEAAEMGFEILPEGTSLLDLKFPPPLTHWPSL